LAEDRQRNKLIYNLVAEKSLDGQCLVLSPRQENIRWLAERFAKAEYSVDYKTVGKSDFDKTKRILICGMVGSGRGLDTNAKYVFILGIPTNITQVAGRLRDPQGFIYIFIDKYTKFETDWKKKCIPYLNKLGCKMTFCTQTDDGLSDPHPYIVQRSKKEPIEESIIDEYMDGE